MGKFTSWSRKIEQTARGYLRPENAKFRGSSTRSVGNVGAKQARIKEIEQKLLMYTHFNDWVEERGGVENLTDKDHKKAALKYGFSQTFGE